MKAARPDYEIEIMCRCAPSHANFHGPKGCTHPVTKFYWNWRTQEYDIINVPCRCQLKVETNVRD